MNVEVIPGVTAALGGGAILGAPLGHDFAVISLSDLLTPMEVIEKGCVQQRKRILLSASTIHPAGNATIIWSALPDSFRV